MTKEKTKVINVGDSKIPVELKKNSEDGVIQATGHGIMLKFIPIEGKYRYVPKESQIQGFPRQLKNQMVSACRFAAGSL